MENNSFDYMGCNYTEPNEEIRSYINFLNCISLVTITVGLIGNGIVLFLTGCRMKRTVNSIWFLNLAIADFIFMLSSGFNILLSFHHPNNNYLYYFLLIIRLNLSASTSFLVVISLDRCLCTWKPVWALNKRTVFKAKITCGIVWVSSISGTFIFTIKPKCQLFISEFSAKYDFTMGFVVPFLIIVSSYITTGVRIKRLKIGKHFRSYRLIIIVILAFFICWLPYYVCSFCVLSALKNNWSASDQEVIFKAFGFSVYLLNLNSCLNPFLYVFMCDDYKTKLKQSLLLVLETAFAEDHLNIKEDKKGQPGQQNNDFNLPVTTYTNAI